MKKNAAFGKENKLLSYDYCDRPFCCTRYFFPSGRKYRCPKVGYVCTHTDI